MDIKILDLFLKSVILFIVFDASIYRVYGCTYLDAESYIQSFTSHAGYGLFNYINNIDDCWVIRAPSGYTTRAYTSNIQLESCCDQLQVRCGVGDSDRLIGSYTSRGNSFDITSSGQYLYFRFTTDSSVTNDGFQVYYHYTSPNNHDCSRYSGDDNDDNNTNNNNNYYRSFRSTRSPFQPAYIVPPIIIMVIIFVVAIGMRICYRAKYGTGRGRVGIGNAAVVMATTNIHNGGSSVVMTNTTRQNGGMYSNNNNLPRYHMTTTVSSFQQRPVLYGQAPPQYQTAQMMPSAPPPPYSSVFSQNVWSTGQTGQQGFQQNVYPSNNPPEYPPRIPPPAVYNNPY